MAVTVVQTALGLGPLGGLTGATSVADPITTTSGNLLVAFSNDGADVSPVFTDNAVGNTWTAFALKSNSFSGTEVRGWYAKNIVGRAGHVFHLAGVGDYAAFVVVELAAADTTTPLDASSLATADDNATPFTVTSGAFATAAEFALAVCGGGSSGGTGTYSESTGFTKLREEGDSNWYTLAVFGKQLSSTSAVTPSFTQASIGFNDAAMIVIGINPAAPTTLSATAAQTMDGFGQSATVVSPQPVTGKGRQHRGWAFSRHQIGITTSLLTKRESGAAWRDWFNLGLNDPTVNRLLAVQGMGDFTQVATALYLPTRDIPGGLGMLLPSTTLDPAKKEPGVSLSNGNLTASSSGTGSAAQAALATTGFTSGKYAFEAVLTANSTFSVIALGISRPDDSGLTAEYQTDLGQESGEVGFRSSGGSYVASSFNPSSPPVGFAIGDVVLTCIDFTAKKVWWLVNGVSTSGDPDTGAGGFSYSNTNTMYAAVSITNVGASMDVRFAAADIVTPLPSGFAAYDAPIYLPAVLAQTLGSVTQAATVTTGNDLNITAAQTLDSVAQAAALTASVAASAAQTLDAVAQTATVVTGTTASAVAAQTLDALTQTATAVALDSASAAQALSDFAQAATVTHGGVSAVAAQAMDTFSQVATLAGRVAAVAAQTLGNFTQSATALSGVVDRSLVAGQTMSPFGQAATITALARAVAAQTMDAMDQAATLRALARLSGSQTMDGVAQIATLAAQYSLSAAQTLQGVVQSATLVAFDTISYLTAAQILDDLVQLARLQHEYIFEVNERTAFTRAQQRMAEVTPVQRLLEVMPAQRLIEVTPVNRLTELE